MRNTLTAIMVIAVCGMGIGQVWGQGYAVKWEMTGLTAEPELPSLIPVNGAGDIGRAGQYAKSLLDLDGDGVSEVLVPDIDQTTGNYKTCKIYDGATHALKSTVNYNFPGKRFVGITPAMYFVDIDNDGTNEMLQLYMDSVTNATGVALINVQTNAIEFSIDSIVLFGLYDIDNDKHLELWYTKNTSATTISLTVIGASNTSTLTSSSSLAKQSLAKLSANYPNPFSNETKIEYYVPSPQNVRLQVFTAEGELVRAIVNGQHKMGEYTVVWDGKSDSGSQLASGFYFYQIQMGDFVSSKKMIILKK